MRLWHALRARSRRVRRLLQVAVLAALVIAVAWPAMQSAEHRAAESLERLRAEHPAAYLQRVRRHGDFDAYLSGLAEVRGYDAWRARPPKVLRGRWRLYETRQHVNARFTPATCRPSALFAEAAVTLRDAGGARQERALYTVAGETLRVKLPEGRRVTVTPVAPGGRIYYLRLAGLPGPDGVRFAYPCD